MGEIAKDLILDGKYSDIGMEKLSQNKNGIKNRSTNLYEEK